MTIRFPKLQAIMAAALLVAGCGGGAGTTATTPPPAAGACDPGDPATAAECGTVLIGFTDADGDFVNYTVDVLGLTLEAADGRSVEVLPGRTRINFTDYVDLTELVTAAAVPPATYVAGTLRLDYADAEIFVTAGDAARAAVVTDETGNPLATSTVKIRLANRDRLMISRGRSALLTLDFDLEASHIVDISSTPATASIAPFILAEVQPVDEKTIRVRGPLVDVDTEASVYRVDLRPFHDRDGDFGLVTVAVTPDTGFEVDGVMYAGARGLEALAALGPGTPTVAGGVLTTAERKFVADLVLAGSSVPGAGLDAVIGNVIERDGNFLTIRGATLVPRDRRAHFHDDVIVEVGPDTRVFRDGYRGSDLTIDAISVGQRLTVRGTVPAAETDAASPQIRFDATGGAVRMHVTRVAGVVNTVLPGSMDITLHTIDRRRSDAYDFSGTGMTPAQDADPGNYTIATGTLTLAALAEGRPVVALGFPAPFGAAPPDFRGRSVIDFTDVGSTLGIAWGEAGTRSPFLRLGNDGIVLDNANEEIGLRHYIRQGTVLIDLTALPSGTTILPRPSDRKLFAIATADSLRQYADFGEFVADLAASLDGSTTARSMYARGRYDREGNVFTAYKLGIFLLEP